MIDFGTGIMFATAKQDSKGATISGATPVQFGTLQDITSDFSFEEKTLYGASQHPLAIGRGKAKFTFKAKTATFSGLILSDLIFGNTALAGIKAVVTSFPVSVPDASPYTVAISAPNTGVFINDLGIVSGVTGTPFTKVAGTPASGQYAVSAGGVYTFAVADKGSLMLVSYEYSATTTGSEKIIQISNDLMGQAPSFAVNLSKTYDGKSITFRFNKCVASKFSFASKNDDFSVPEFDFTAMADATGSVGYISVSE
jgi:hypothetical protein